MSMMGRRGLLMMAGALVVSFPLPGAGAAAQNGAAAEVKSVSPDAVQGFLAVSRDGHVTVYSGKVELGTGVETALLQIVADELDVPLDHVSLVQGDTALTPDQGPTNASFAIEKGGMQLRRAAATLRTELLRRAARQLGASVTELRIVDGVVHATGGAGVGIGLLAAQASIVLKLDPAAPLKPPVDYKLVGKPVPRVDIPAKVFASFTYMQDFRLPDMLHGRIIHPPAIGAELLSVDENPVRAMPGNVRVVRIGNFLGVVADTEWDAIKAAQALKADWSDVSNLPDEAQLFDYVRELPVVSETIMSNVGDAQQRLAQAARRLSATYDFAIQTHGSIGPSCAVAQLKDGQVTCWSASQATHNLRRQLAATLALPLEKVRCIYLEGAGCYGRNGHEDAAAEAVLLARAVGRPVRVQWMRQDEHGWDPKGPPVLIDMQGGLDAQGRISAWQGDFLYPQATAVNVALLGSELAGLPSDGGTDPGGIQNDVAIPYRFADVRTTLRRTAPGPFRHSWIRSPGRMQNTFANEAFLDELAALAGTDPLEMRLRTLDDARGAEVLERVARLSNWRTRPGPDPEADVVTGLGLAYVKYEMYRTYVAAVAEVEVRRSSGQVRVRRFFVAHDCGQIINPDGTRNQIEGNIVQAVSRTLIEQVTFNRKMITSLDWASYPILTFPDVPEVVIDLIDRPETPPWGVGEPATAIVPPAIANAIHDAAGIRLRSVPFTAEKVRAALGHA
ncbi:MAG TPA: molybdopterin cofactor-binding domain-containing protein [Crenalkalicoccus sp.]|nr:molybdopterin cofactor-binding domain-containing protein [Crenalkalicoccus sp.]